MPSAIHAAKLSRGYGSRRGIEDVDLELEAGSLLGVLGPNGAGKTTTIRLLLGFLRPSAGRASIFGCDCWRESALAKREVGYLPSDFRLYPRMDGRVALRLAGRIRGADLVGPGALLAERFGLELDVRVRDMSRGMRQKLGIVLAFAHAPRLLVLDEPTTGLDPLMQEELIRLLAERAHAGAAVFFSSHTLSEVEAACDRVVILRAGRIRADESLDAMRARARRRVEIVFADEQLARALQPPDTLRVTERSGSRWIAELAGPAPPLLDWLAQHPLADLVIHPPDLETLFRSFYDGEAD